MSLTYSEIVDSMGRTLGVDMSRFKNEKGFNIVYNNDVVVTVEPCAERDGYYHIYSPICDLPSDPELLEDLYTMMMRGHLFGYASHNNYFGIDKKRGKVFLFKLVNIARMKDVNVFKNKVHRFLAAVEFWQEPLKSPRKYLDAVEEVNKLDLDPGDPSFLEEFKKYV